MSFAYFGLGSILNQLPENIWQQNPPPSIQLSFHHVFVVVGEAQVTFRHRLGRFTFGLEII